MIDKLFDIKDLPDLADNYSDEKVKSSIYEIYKNYKCLINDNFKMLDFSINNEINKPLILFYLLFGVELFLKLYLIKFSDCSLEDIGNKGHKVTLLFNEVKHFDTNENFEELLFLLKGFKYKNNNKIIIDKYYDFKYNHEKGTEKLLLDYEIDEKEKSRIKEVIEWTKSCLKII